MMEANNELDQHEVAAAQQEQEQQQLIIAAATKQRHLKIDSVLEKKGTFPLQNRNKIDVLIKEFLEKLGDDIHDMLCDNKHAAEADTYTGLDSDRDTEEEVETAIRFFPEVLTRRKAVFDGDFHYPIQEVAFACDEDFGDWQCNVKSVSFIPIVARLAIEFGLFEEDERGGLLCLDREGDNVLHRLMLTDQIIDGDNREQQHEADDKFLQVLIKLRQLDLLKKEDIKRYELLHKLSHCNYIFTEKRYQMLVEWDPNALTQTDRHGVLPFNIATIQGIQFVFEYGIRYFPKKKGISLLFHKPEYDCTDFQHACRNFGYEKVMKVVEDTLARYSDTPVNVPEALLSAAIDEKVHLDCVYFLLRREPDLLLKLLPQLLPSLSSSSSSSSVSASGSPNDNDDDNKSRNSSKKRKRSININYNDLDLDLDSD
ncbi:hypothetical protein FRACYDRAFT_278048 [Fragilariopsis cylindrus CCMP1102]|uniref:Uncharacterized protein n=1 Tax=Fragilariopsis cylindrus CCMP1102 TaxID=635003 RepID=A0A1E7EM09_9STRA|nr:hypothetical protein FRACYDRAFT_278048 [Fragilariopsis cylindrus CCMP1102]|eukprot:OEU06886.1 hypothetical protein FRACYDRAFT_278048 [Fragilariopsis cylindrus CCMP1102]